MGLTRLGSCFLLFLALYQISWSSKCHHVALQQQQQQPSSSSQASSSKLHGLDAFQERSTRTTTTTTRRRRIPLYDLVDTKQEFSCPKNLVLVNDTRYPPPDPTKTSRNVDNNTTTSTRRRRIPHIIHVTSKSRCLTPAFAENLEKWKRTFPNYTFVLHNDEAMDRFLFETSHYEFPHLSQIASACLHTAAGKADLWRALILYEYGGIYTDIDNAPGEILNSSTIAHGDDDDDNNDDNLQDEAFFVVENEGMLSQYFFAAAPRHSLLYLLIQTTLQRLLAVPSVENQYVPFVTGPGALKAAFVEFMQAQLMQPNKKQQQKQDDKKSNDNKYTTYQKVRAGRYTGLFNWTVTVAGSARTGSQEYVQRNVIYQKRRIYQEMGMVHFSRIQKHHQEEQNNKKNGEKGNNNDYYYYNPDESCLQRVYRLQQQERNNSNQ